MFHIKHALAYPHPAGGGAEAFTSATIFKKCGGRTSSGWQER